jgi:UDP-GlcNAc:undecaprenyl-phosphate/decaprenyl-phosphate GlcNAc-1-phosphate transferase
VSGYAIVLAVAFLTTLAVTPLVRLIAIRAGLVVAPSDARHVHDAPTPTLGGAAMLVGFVVAFAVASQIPQFHDMFRSSSEPIGLLLGAGVMFTVGAIDDIRDVSPPAKIAGMVLAAGLLAMFGITMFFFRVPFNLGHLEVVVLSPDIAPLITVLWVVVLANAINLIDGLDGLAAGICLIAGAALFLFAHQLFHHGLLDGSNLAPLVAMLAVGVCAGFLPWNVQPARIFMGDAGALFLGLLLAVTSITVGGRTDADFSANNYFFFAPLAIPIVILGIPVFDAVLSFFRRLLRGRSWSAADSDHLHHRLVRLGHGRRRAVFILWAWTAILSGIALLPVYTDRGNAIVPFVIAAMVLALYMLFHPGVRTARELAVRSRHPTAAGLDDDEAPGAEVAGDLVDLEERRRRRA